MDATDLHHDVLLALVHVGHHPVLTWRRKFDSSKNLAGQFVPSVELQRGVWDDLTSPLAERTSLHEEVARYHLDRPTGTTSIGNVHAREAGVLSDNLSGFSHGQ